MEEVRRRGLGWGKLLGKGRRASTPPAMCTSRHLVRSSGRPVGGPKGQAL